MYINKEKARALAQKYVQKGQLDKAVREYERLAEETPTDIRSLLKVAELQTQLGNLETGAETYMRVAGVYVSEGFLLKAVAVYKQVLKLSSEHLDANLKLGEMYTKLNLNANAVEQYRHVCKIYEDSGRAAHCIPVLRTIVSLVPQQIVYRVKLAELCAQYGAVEEAKRELQVAAKGTKVHEQLDDFIRVSERILQLDPSQIYLARELGNFYL